MKTNRLLRTQHGNCLLYITENDLATYMRGEVKSVYDKYYIAAQEAEWYSADYPEGISESDDMFEWMCNQLAGTVRQRRLSSSADVYRIDVGHQLHIAELRKELQDEAVRDELSGEVILATKEDRTQELYDTETFMVSDGFWYAVAGQTNTSGTGLIKLHYGVFLVVTIG